MQITPPYGYQRITPFLKSHRIKLPVAGSLPPFARTSNALPVTFTEFFAASRDYPIVFSSNDNGATFAATMVLGLSAGENLFCSDGRWMERNYLPAYIRRYPFCMTKVTVDAVEQQQRLICIEDEFLSDEGAAMFDNAGDPTPRWRELETLLHEFEVDLERTRELCGILADFKLLEPFTLQASMTAGGAMHLTGMYRVDEKKLEFMTAGELKTLIRKGAMAKIYSHISSLDNFQRLLDLRASRQRAA
jgi:hypothetical protein